MTLPSRRSRAAAVAALVLVSVLLSASGCGGRREVRPEPSPAVLPTGPKVAVAPMENMSNDLSASDILRDAFVEGVARKGFAVVPVAESDRILRETLGISYGGQLPSTTPEEVCNALGAEIIAGALGNLLLNPMTPQGRRVGENIARKLPNDLLKGVDR